MPAANGWLGLTYSPFLSSLPFQVYPCCPVGDDRLQVVDVRMRHPQRLENAIGHEIAVGFPGHFLDEQPEQKVAGVAVVPLFAGREFQRVFRHEVEDLRRSKSFRAILKKSLTDV